MGAMVPPSRKSCYNFRVTEINGVVDGDTIDVDIDLGFGVWMHKERVRMMGIDTPESRTRDKEEKKFHVSLLEKLIDKQRILYTRLSLSDDPEAKQMKDNIYESAKMMGLPDGTDMNVVFNNMSKMLDVMKDQIDKTGSDL